jgi:RNA polymerase sigma factor (TIGR02999 family)
VPNPRAPVSGHGREPVGAPPQLKWERIDRYYGAGFARPGLRQERMSDEPPAREPPAVEPRHDVTQLLVRWRAGDDRALEQLLTLVYDELSRLADRYLRHEAAGQTLQTHDLVHEAFLRLIGQRHVDWQNRAHFFGIAAQMMRRILTDRARRRAAARHGGGARHVVLDDVAGFAAGQEADIVAVDEALVDLEQVDPELARIVELRFFGGLDHGEIAAVIGVSNVTVRRRFRLAKAWLFRRLSGTEPGDGD